MDINQRLISTHEAKAIVNDTSFDSSSSLHLNWAHLEFRVSAGGGTEIFRNFILILSASIGSAVAINIIRISSRKFLSQLLKAF